MLIKKMQKMIVIMMVVHYKRTNRKLIKVFRHIMNGDLI